jgi:hypothetical protein
VLYSCLSLLIIINIINITSTSSTMAMQATARGHDPTAMADGNNGIWNALWSYVAGPARSPARPGTSPLSSLLPHKWPFAYDCWCVWHASYVQISMQLLPHLSDVLHGVKSRLASCLLIRLPLAACYFAYGTISLDRKSNRYIACPIV